MNQPKPTATVGPLPCPVGGYFAAPNVDKPVRLTRSSPQRSSVTGSSSAELQQLADRLRNEKLLRKQRTASKALLPQPGALLRMPNDSLAPAVAGSSSELTRVVNDSVKQRPGPLSLSMAAEVAAAPPLPASQLPAANQNDWSTSSSTDTPVSPRGLNVNAPVFIPSSQSAVVSTRKTSVTTTTAVLPPGGRPFLVGINSQPAAGARRSSLQETVGARQQPSGFKFITPLYRTDESVFDLNENATNNNSSNILTKSGGAGDGAVNREKLSSAESVVCHQTSILPNSSSIIKRDESSSKPVVVPNCPLMTSSAAAATAAANVLFTATLKDLSRDRRQGSADDGMCSNMASGSPSPVDDDLSVLDDDDDEKVAVASDEVLVAAEDSAADSVDPEPLKKTYNRVDILRIYAQNKGTFPRPNCLANEFNNASGVFDPSKWIQHVWALEQANGMSYGTRLTKLPYLAASGPAAAPSANTTTTTATKGHPHGPPSFISREEVLKNASTPMQLLLMQHAKKSP